MIQEKVAKIKMNKVQTPNAGPVIAGVRDGISGLTDGTLTAGSVLDITGSRLKVYPNRPDDGVYFIDAGGKEYKAVSLVKNKPSRLIVMLPALSPGSYTLEVRTHFVNSAVPGIQFHKVRVPDPTRLIL
jgi:hypothetical protein